jgi:hypothetical protein
VTATGQAVLDPDVAIWNHSAGRIAGKVKVFGAVVRGVRPRPKTEGFARNSPGPSGFRSAGARGVEPLVRTTGTNFALLLADRLADRETELFPDNNIMV